MTDDLTANERAYLAMADKLVADYMAAFQVRDPNLPVSARMTCRLVAELAAAVFEHLKEHASRIDALESHGIKFVGNYQRAQPYRRGFVTTHKGSMWVALRDVAEGIEPGTSPADWQLSQKAKTRVKAGSRTA